MSEILIKFGERVRQLRKEKRMSQEELADKANLHRTYIGMIGKHSINSPFHSKNVILLL